MATKHCLKFKNLDLYNILGQIIAGKNFTVMSGLHSHRGYSLRLSRNCERDEVRTNVDIHTIVGEL